MKLGTYADAEQGEMIFIVEFDIGRLSRDSGKEDAKTQALISPIYEPLLSQEVERTGSESSKKIWVIDSNFTVGVLSGVSNAWGALPTPLHSTPLHLHRPYL